MFGSAVSVDMLGCFAASVGGGYATARCYRRRCFSFLLAEGDVEDGSCPGEGLRDVPYFLLLNGWRSGTLVSHRSQNVCSGARVDGGGSQDWVAIGTSEGKNEVARALCMQ